MSLNELVSNRVDFKLAVCHIHLESLKQIDKETGSLSSSEGTGEAEKELDEFLYQIITAKDSLLQEINEKLGLKIPIREVTLGAINHELVRCGKSNVTNDLNQICNPQHWLWLLNEFHNHSKHRKMISRAVSVGIAENVNTGESSSSVQTRLINPVTQKPSDVDAVSFFDDMLKNMEKLVSDTGARC